MEKLQTIQEVTTFVRENHLVFLYVSQEDCSVCHVLQPKLTELLKKYPEIELREVEAHKVKEISAEYLIFSAPTMLFFVDGKEYIREGKFVQFKKLDAQIEHIYSHTKDSA
ncbi:thioredoxin family protein [Enterococcus quebecensis]|uniref:Thiol reductase thioredoxin n=1 Tax=Enterococcus quebecensis TaxID=903983 RepID=A0A1E5GSN3_9ENTE|nr:thioredoxin family protein [Enterococcus quebecensis]OEG15707.1 thiol reductase thioredoxin [Enterococcus quebecensis]